MREPYRHEPNHNIHNDVANALGIFFLSVGIIAGCAYLIKTFLF